MEKLNSNNSFFIWNSDDDKNIKKDKHNTDGEVWNDPMFEQMYEHGVDYCYHKWKIYVGFTEVYRYCTKCNLKSEA